MRVLIAALALFLAGCATTKPGEAYVKAHPELDPETKRRIAAGEAFEGMTEEQVAASLGRPVDVRRVADGREFWEYPSVILIIKNGVLDSWVDKRTLY